VTRKDGHHPIVLRQCGPIRHRVAARKQADERPFSHQVIQRFTDFTMPPDGESEGRIAIHKIYASLAEDETRNDLIFDDAMTALEAGRSPLVLTERRAHLEYLVERFRGFAKNIVVLKGGMGTLGRMAERRLRGYRALGYELVGSNFGKDPEAG